jgi:hypothetical protein
VMNQIPVPTPKQVAARKRRADEVLALQSVREPRKVVWSSTTGDAPKSGDKS